MAWVQRMFVGLNLSPSKSKIYGTGCGSCWSGTNHSSSFMQQRTTLPGDILLVTAFISYVGCFTKQFRLDLLNKMWQPFLKTLEVGSDTLRISQEYIYCNDSFLQPPLPITEGLDPLSLLTDDAQIATWNNEGLPSDRMSTENATILSNSDRWPLMIDPQVKVL